MFERPYGYQPPYQNNSFQTNPYAQQWYQPYNPTNDPAFFQTPYQYLKKPKQPTNLDPFIQAGSMYKPQQHIYPKNNLFAYFQDPNGQVDLDKMFSTAGQLANTVQQFSPVVKQFSSIMKSFK
ncbi:YppG family protein [Virgibacillus byunsanensis]|uniref:YppG family protein n=1 Tax=Virgibacillus byunsanensis TaxID=570945 RepID=A0ABW3LL40_9BACI